MTEEQKRLLEKYSELNKSKLKEENTEIVSIPSSVTNLSKNQTERVQRDEFNLSYDELIEEFNFFKKSAIMKPSTFERLWNS